MNDELKMESIIFGLKTELAEKDKEIERLKKANEELYYSGLNENTARLGDMRKIEWLQDRNAELQKQVDELKLELIRYKNLKIKIDEASYEQAVKDTAKAVITDMFKEIEGYERIDRILERIAKRYGVEVE